MALAVGIAGLPNVGKSTLLNALSHAEAEASNYPFCTIDQNTGMAAVPDTDLQKLQEILAPKETNPTTIRFVDIAGLVEGASKGEGLGNKFLGHIREVDAILHVVRCFEDENIVHSTGQANPVHDVEIVETEFLLADLDTAQRAAERWKATVRTGKGPGKEEHEAFVRAAEALGQGKPIRDLELSENEQRILVEARFLTAKPCLYLANTDESDPMGEGPLASGLRAAKGAEREEISELPPEDQDEFLKGMGLEETALSLVVTACYGLLDLITFYTIANDKLSAWQLRKGDTAAHAAGTIHSDMEKGFIRAEVMGLADLVKHGSRHALHDHGLIHTVGRDYVVHDKDVLQVLFKA
jgi:GTP-binding protein YchF